MKYLKYIAIAILFAGCGGGEAADSGEVSGPPGQKEHPKTLAEFEPVYMDYKGLGPISSLSLADAIDTTMTAKGEEVFQAKCTACHKVGKRFVGPDVTGIMSRRSPEWIMNMILNPEQMTSEDPIGKLLLIEYNGSPMANQNLTEEEARAVLEYFRTLQP